MGRAFEYRKATKLKRWGHMAKTFTKLGKQIAIAVKAGGPEPENNPTLRAIIANCKRENMPKDNIARAIKNACGKDTSDYKEVTYEGYGPHGVAVFVDTLTDNTTRTVADVRSIFNKFSGNLGTTGSLSFLFDHKAVFTFKKKEGLDMYEPGSTFKIITSSACLEEGRSNFCAGIYLDEDYAALCACDITTGKAHATAFS
jgi:YebC/PmpR family DNA-binding regulatory protein